MLGNKTVVDSFNTSWEQCIMAVGCDPYTEIFPEQRILLRRVWRGEYIAIYGDSDYPTTITTRWNAGIMRLPVEFHNLFQRVFRLKKVGIKSQIIVHDNIITCIYTRGGGRT